MEFKINEGLTNQSSYRRKNDFFRRFKHQLSILLSKTRNKQHFPELDKVYIKNYTLHKDLEFFLNDKQNNCQFLIGDTGIGKSTAIRGFFGIDSSKTVIRDETIILTSFVDGIAITKKEQVENRIGRIFYGACMEVERTFSGLQFSDNEFYEFIYKNAPHTLAESVDLNNNTNEATLINMRQNAKRTYSLELLKFYLQKISIKNIVIIIDDIDSIEDGELLTEFVHLALKSWECLQNNDSGVYTRILIAERPETYRNYFQGKRWFKAFGIPISPIEIHEPAGLADIFKKRFDYLTKDSSAPKISNIEEWEKAYDVLMKICKDLVFQNENTILRICNNNVRDSMSLLLELLTSGFWLQKSDVIKSYFVVRPGHYRKPTDILILKSIGYKNNYIYINGREQLLTNLLKCRRGNKHKLLTLQIVAAFVSINDRYGHEHSVVDKKQLSLSLQKIISPKINSSLPNTIDNLIDYLIEREILHISSTDEGDKTKLYLSPKGSQIWYLLGQNSILLEMFRDDIWLNKDMHNKKSARCNSYDEKFADILKLATEYINYENEIVNDAISSKSLSILRDVLGENLPSLHISKGVIESIRKYYQITKIKRPEAIDSNLKIFIKLTKNVKSKYFEE